MEESFFFLTTVAGSSCISTMSSAFDLHTLRQRVNSMVFQTFQDLNATADQDHVDPVFFCGLNRAKCDLIRGVVSAHDIHDDTH